LHFFDLWPPPPQPFKEDAEDEEDEDWVTERLPKAPNPVDFSHWSPNASMASSISTFCIFS
jgi:hypothetical protein